MVPPLKNRGIGVADPQRQERNQDSLAPPHLTVGRPGPIENAFDRAGLAALGLWEPISPVFFTRVGTRLAYLQVVAIYASRVDPIHDWHAPN